MRMFTVTLHYATQSCVRTMCVCVCVCVCFFSGHLHCTLRRFNKLLVYIRTPMGYVQVYLTKGSMHVYSSLDMGNDRPGRK